MKIAIIYPEVYEVARYKEKRKEFPPFGVLYLAAALENENFDVKILKVNINKYQLDLSEYNVVAFSIPSSVTYDVIKKARISSKYSKNALIIVGGLHPTIYPEDTLLDLKPHIIGIGAGEETIVEIVYAFFKKDVSAFRKIKGICFIENDVIIKTDTRTNLKEVKELPIPTRYLLEENDFIMTNRLSDTNLRMTHVMFSRGCPFSCNYCAAGIIKPQLRTGKSVRKELEFLKEKYNIDGFAIVDDNFVINKKNVIDICSSINDLNLKWSALSRIDTVDEEVLKIMYDSGCIEIKYGLETLSRKLLKAMKKDISEEKVIHNLQISNSIGLKVKVFLLHGFPGEDEHTTNETINFLENYGYLINSVSLFRFVPLPGTYVFDHPKEFNLRPIATEKKNWSKYHIHYNNQHWWGTKKDFNAMNKAYLKLEEFVNIRWNKL